MDFFRGLLTVLFFYLIVFLSYYFGFENGRESEIKDKILMKDITKQYNKVISDCHSVILSGGK